MEDSNNNDLSLNSTPMLASVQSNLYLLTYTFLKAVFRGDCSGVAEYAFPKHATVAHELFWVKDSREEMDS